jgi:hypothetical protein
MWKPSELREQFTALYAAHLETRRAESDAHGRMAHWVWQRLREGSI